jgi:hypothetical protein
MMKGKKSSETHFPSSVDQGPFDQGRLKLRLRITYYGKTAEGGSCDELQAALFTCSSNIPVLNWAKSLK